MKKEKILNLFLFILIFFAILSIIILRPLDNLDELWNYNFARNIADGLIPYKDFNMLQMPLLPLICGIILRIIFNELLVMRVLAALLCATIIYIAYKIFNILNIKKEISVILVFLISLLLIESFCIDYNFATLLLVLLIIYNEIKYYKKYNVVIKNECKLDLLLGVLAGLTLTLKQTTGLFVCIALLGNKLVFVRNKEEIKIYFKSFVYRLIGIIIPVTLMFIYLIFNNAVSDFVSYTIKGVSGFSNYISYNNLMNLNIIGILSILVPITFVYQWIKTIIYEKDKISYFFLVYGLAMFVVCFPISDRIHFLIGSLPTIILLLYETYNLLKILSKKLIFNKKISYTILFFITALIIQLVIYYTVLNFYGYCKTENLISDLKHYKYIPISESLKEQIEAVDSYIKNNEDVKILDATAAIYMIPLDRYNKNYDMLLKGNLGYDGENLIIEEILNAEYTQYLILNDKFRKNWQTPLNIIDYAKENKTKIGEVQIFDIYK